MAALLISFVFVGLPVGLGSYLLLTPRAGRNPKAGAFLLFYAGVLCIAFVLIVPEGAIGTANYRVHMPSAFAIGVVLGTIGALFERIRGRNG